MARVTTVMTNRFMTIPAQFKRQAKVNAAWIFPNVFQIQQIGPG